MNAIKASYVLKASALPKTSKRSVTLDLRKVKPAGGLVATVFGATGFVGRYLVNRLARSGAQIVIPYRGEESSYTHLKVMGDVGQIVPLPYTIRDDAMIAKAVSKSNIVLNLLGRRFDTRNFKLEEVHITAAQKIAKLSKEAGVTRFIQFSTVNAETTPKSRWATTKLAGEEAVREVFPDATIIRPTTIFGTQDWFLNRFGYFCRWLPFVPLLFNEKSKIQPLYVRDVASALMAILADSNSHGKTFELGGPDVYTFRELLEQIVFEYAKVDHGRILTFNHDLAKKLAWPFEQSRTCAYTQEEVEFFKQDVVVPSDAKYTMDYLNLELSSVHDHSLNILRPYRKPMRYDETVNN